MLLLPFLSLLIATVLTATIVYMTVSCESGSLSPSYRKILVAIAFYTYYVDVVFHLNGAPKVSWPCFYFEGILQGYHFDSPLVISMTVIFMSWNIIPYGVALVYRHQLLQNANASLCFRPATITIFFVLVGLVFCSIGASFNEIRDKIIIAVHCKIGGRIYLFVANVGFVILSSALFLIAVTAHIHAILRSHKEMSEESKRMFWKCTQALIVQTLSPVVFAVIPSSIATVLYASERETGVLLDVCIALMHSHSVAYSITAILTTAPIRKRFFSSRKANQIRVGSIDSKHSDATRHTTTLHNSSMIS